MINFVLSFFGKIKHTKEVMLWNGVKMVHLRLTDSEYKNFVKTTLPMGFSIISEMNI
jgi:hypothetical protein